MGHGTEIFSIWFHAINSVVIYSIVINSIVINSLVAQQLAVPCCHFVNRV